MTPNYIIHASAENPDWLKWLSFTEKTLTMAMEKLNLTPSEASVAFVSLDEIAKLNLDYRNIEGPTDVLSFHQGELFERHVLLGDIIISPEYAQKEVDKKSGATLESEIALLLVHGLLHLLGHDHAKPEEKKSCLTCKMNFLRTYKTKLYLSLSCIILSGLSFPFAWNSPQLIHPWISALAACVYLVPLLYLLQDLSIHRQRFQWALATLSLGAFLNLSWATVAMQEYGNMPLSASTVVAFLWGATVSLFTVFPLIFIFYFKPSRHVALFAAATLCLFQIILEQFPLDGCPWLQIGYAWYGWDSVIQTADVWGTKGITFLIFWVNTSIFYFSQSKEKRHLYAPALVLIVSFFYGTLHLHVFSPPATQRLRIGVVQGNISQDQKWTPAGKRLARTRYDELSMAMFSSENDLNPVLRKQNPKLILWPESSVPKMHPTEMKKVGFSMSYLKNNALLLFGSIAYESHKGKRVYKNASFLANSDRSVLQHYEKQILVPFGEFVPKVPGIPLHKLLPPALGDLKSGKESVLFEGPGYKFGNLICYESLFEQLSRKFVRQGAQFLVNTTNDAWFNRSSGPYQHVNFLKFRAIENRRSVVRSANTGISGWFDPYGRLFQKTPLFETASFVDDIPLRNDLTFYGRAPWLCLIFCLLVIFLYVWKDKHEH